MFINNEKVNRTEKIAVFTIIIILCLLSIYVESTSKIMWPVMPGWVAICGIAVFVASIQTAYLLYYQSKIESDPSLALLASGYMGISLLALGRMIFLPDILYNTDSWEQDSQISIWLWFVWHAIFPIIVILYSLHASGKLRFSYLLSQWIFIISPFIVFFVISVIVYNIDLLPIIGTGNKRVSIEFDIRLCEQNLKI